MWRHTCFGGPKVCVGGGGSRSAEHVRTLLNPALALRADSNQFNFKRKQSSSQNKLHRLPTPLLQRPSLRSDAQIAKSNRILVFAESGKEYGDCAEVEPRFRILDPALFHQRDEVFIHVGVGVDQRTVVRHAVTTHLVQDLCQYRDSK